MGSVGKVAFIAILGLGAITGVLVYYVFGDATPAPGIMESSRAPPYKEIHLMTPIHWPSLRAT
jgi:hypothetical protein